jgi:hypothetical protein
MGDGGFMDGNLNITFLPFGQEDFASSHPKTASYCVYRLILAKKGKRMKLVA